MLKLLIEKHPEAIHHATNLGCLPIHLASQNKNVTVNIIQLLMDAAPDSVSSLDEDGDMPLHDLCRNEGLDERAAMDILKLLIKKHPEAIRHADNDGDLPIQFAAYGGRSPEFCRVLIEAYPGSERIANRFGWLPFHGACSNGTFATVKYLYEIYPDAINHAAPATGYYPIHKAIDSIGHRDNPIAAVVVANFLLDCNPSVKFQKHRGKSLLYYACRTGYNDSNIEAGIEAIKAIYDAHPEAIEENTIASNIHDRHQLVQSFINSNLLFALEAKDQDHMTTPDGNGELPLHTALENNVTLGSIKLLVKGNPLALQSPDNSGALPLHVACQHHDSASVVQYLLGLDTSTLDAVDRDGNTALHHACRGAKYETITLLMEKYGAASVSKRNAHGKLPVDLLFVSDRVSDRESIDFTESSFRLLTAYPEAIMNYNATRQQANTVGCSSQSGKKRKLGEV
eukprot:scaffold4432_cov108-Skeletonema_dohrnii-CCMP3373.AAC.3